MRASTKLFQLNPPLYLFIQYVSGTPARDDRRRRIGACVSRWLADSAVSCHQGTRAKHTVHTLQVYLNNILSYLILSYQ